MNLFLRNLVAIAFPAAFSILLSFLLNHFSPLIATNWPYGLIFLIALSFILNLIYAYQAGSVDFTQLLIVAIVIKLLLSLVGIVVYSFLDKPGFFNFSIQFILHYVLFTIFEIRYLLHIIKTHPLNKS